jgi:hypothetical protein
MTAMNHRKLISRMWAGALAAGLAFSAGAKDARAEQAPAASKPKADSKGEGKAPARAKPDAKQEAKPDAKPGDKTAGKGKGKAGDACKTDEDCDQSSHPMTCRQSGDAQKCVAVPIHPVT